MIIVGIGEVAFSQNKSESIVTHALGSCVAVIMHCHKTRHTALAHVVLPNKDKFSTLSKEAYFADKIVPRMLSLFLSKEGCDRTNLEVTLIGGAMSIRENDQFQVGKKNLECIKGILNSHRIVYSDHETGGRFSRTVTVKVKNGKIHMTKNKILI